MLAFTTALTLLGLAAAQTAGQASDRDLAIVQANFQQAQIAGQPTYMLPTFTPQGTLGLTFNGNAAMIGQRIEQANAGTAPTVAIAAAANGSRINAQSTYTVMMVDADIVGTNAQTTPLTRHWLVNTVALTGSGPYTVNLQGGTPVTSYAGPGPASGSGPHRYVVLLYAQSSSFSPPANLSTAGVGLGTWNLQSYVESTGLGPLVAANYFQVENGQATVTPPSTSAVNTATISSVTTPTQSGVATTSRTSTGTGTGTSSAASGAATSRAAASETKSLGLGMGVVVGVIGVVGCVIGAGLGL